MSKDVESNHAKSPNTSYREDIEKKAVVRPILFLIGIRRAILEEWEVTTKGIGHT